MQHILRYKSRNRNQWKTVRFAGVLICLLLLYRTLFWSPHSLVPSSSDQGRTDEAGSLRLPQEPGKIFSNSSEVTGTMTSCKRVDLMIMSLKSIFANHPPGTFKEFIVLLDCYERETEQMLRKEFGNLLTIINSTATSRTGERRLMANIETLGRMVKTRFWFHTEEDWEFVRPNFIQEGMKVLDFDPIVYQVRGRDRNDGHPPWNESMPLLQAPGGEMPYKYNHIKWHGVWGSFTLNPTLTRTSDFWHIHRGRFTQYSREEKINKVLASTLGLEAVGTLFDKPYYFHRGKGFSSLGHKL